MKKKQESYQIESKILDVPGSRAKRNVATIVDIKSDGSISVSRMEHSFESLESMVDYLRDVANQIEYFINNPEND